MTLKCCSCNAELEVLYERNDYNKLICKYSCPCGVAKPGSEDYTSPELDLDAFLDMTYFDWDIDDE